MAPVGKLPLLNDEEIDMCRKAFMVFDKDGSGTINVSEMKVALQALGQHPTDEDLFVMISQIDEDGSHEIEFDEFVMAIQLNKSMCEKNNDETETVDAFAALGGNFDKSGKISVDKLRSILAEFELTVSIDKLIGEVDRDTSGFVDYEGFKLLLSS